MLLQKYKNRIHIVMSLNSPLTSSGRHLTFSLIIREAVVNFPALTLFFATVVFCFMLKVKQTMRPKSCGQTTPHTGVMFWCPHSFGHSYIYLKEQFTQEM